MNTEITKRLAAQILDAAVANSRPHPEALDLIATAVKTNVRLNSRGDFEVTDENGVVRVSNREGYPNMTLHEYLDELKSTRPLLFDHNSAPRGDKPTHGNPFLKRTWNVTAQMRLMIDDPATAARLEAEANQSK